MHGFVLTSCESPFTISLSIHAIPFPLIAVFIDTVHYPLQVINKKQKMWLSSTFCITNPTPETICLEVTEDISATHKSCFIWKLFWIGAVYLHNRTREGANLQFRSYHKINGWKQIRCLVLPMPHNMHKKQNKTKTHTEREEDFFFQTVKKLLCAREFIWDQCSNKH